MKLENSWMSYGILWQKHIIKNSEHFVYFSKFEKKMSKTQKRIKNAYLFWKINEIIWNEKKDLIDKFFYRSVNNLLSLSLYKINVSDIWNTVYFFRFLLYHEVLKLRSNQKLSALGCTLLKGNKTNAPLG